MPTLMYRDPVDGQFKPYFPPGMDRPTADARYVQTAGSTMTGPLGQPLPPIAPEHVTNKEYVDGRLWYGTQTEYDALPVKDPEVLYVVTGV